MAALAVLVEDLTTKVGSAPEVEVGKPEEDLAVLVGSTAKAVDHTVEAQASAVKLVDHTVEAQTSAVKGVEAAAAAPDTRTSPTDEVEPVEDVGSVVATARAWRSSGGAPPQSRDQGSPPTATPTVVASKPATPSTDKIVKISFSIIF